MINAAMLLISILAASAALADSGTVYSVTATCKQWQRIPVIGVPGGTLLDASGTIADYQSGAAMEASARYASNTTAAAYTGMSNALARLYSVTGSVSRFTDRIYMAGDLQPDALANSNLWWHVAAERIGGDGTNYFYVYFSRALQSAPKLAFSFETEAGASFVAASCIDFATRYETNGYQNCALYACPRPALANGITMRLNPAGRFGAPGGALALSQAGLQLIVGGATNQPVTATITNSSGLVRRFQSGLLTWQTNLNTEVENE